jgi:sugar/nucleoside kinase (ribokinase family)
MEISTKRFDDSSLPDESGQYEYRYTGVVYTFVASDREFVFRLYDDEPSAATLLQPSDWNADLFNTESFRKAVGYLRLNKGVKTIKAYNHMMGSYTPVELPSEGSDESVSGRGDR